MGKAVGTLSFSPRAPFSSSNIGLLESERKISSSFSRVTMTLCADSKNKREGRRPSSSSLHSIEPRGLAKKRMIKAEHSLTQYVKL